MAARIQTRIESRTESRDLLWEFDAVQRLAEAQVAGSLCRFALDSEDLSTPVGQAAKVHEAVSKELRDLLDVGRFVRPGPLWWGFNWADAKHQAEFEFAPHYSDWVAMPPDVEDPVAYAIARKKA